jgi:hypothetical protein
MEVLYGFIKVIENVGINGDRVGQFGESREYWMGRRMSGPKRKFRAPRK